MSERSEHPSAWRLFRAHPALGLEELEGELLSRPPPRELGVAWCALPAAEQRWREADLKAALARAASDPASGWSIELETTEMGALGVWMDRWKALALERELLDHVSEQARRREQEAGEQSALARREALDRTLRARALVVWDRHGWRAFIGAMALAGLLGLHPWGDGGVGDAALRVAAGLVAVIALGGLVERWYRRSSAD